MQVTKRIISTPHEQESASPNRFLFADILRCLGTFAVIVIHASYQLFYMPNDISIDRWLSVNFWESCSRWSVPVFFMLSGMLLLNSSKGHSIKSILLKRVPRLLVPLILWSQIYLLWINRENIENGNPVPFLEGLGWMYQTNVFLHLWFLYTLIGIYLSVPILDIVAKHASKQIKLYLLIGWLVFNGILGLVRFFYELKIGIEVPMFGLYLGYFMAGAWLKDYKLTPQSKRLVIVLTSLCLMVTFFGTYYLKQTGMKLEAFYEYSSPAVMFASLGIFVLARNMSLPDLLLRGGWLSTFVKEVSSLSFSVYLSHMLVLEMITVGFFYKPINGNSIHPILGIPLLSIFVFIVCLVVAKILRFIPVMRWLVP